MFAKTESDEQLSAGRAISLLIASSDAVRLRSLSAQETLQLLMSLFGDVPNVRLVADRLHAASGGSPA